jgi:carnitine-CoA ligase
MVPAVRTGATEAEEAVGDYPLQQRTIGHLLADKAARNGAKTWLLWQDASYSYADLQAMTNRYANGFSSLGIAKGQHVAVMLSNGPQFFFVVWGLGKIGAVAVPLNTAAKGELLRYFIDQSRSSWIVVGEEWADRIDEVSAGLGELKGFVCVGDARGLSARGKPAIDLRTFESLSASTPPIEAVRYSDPHLIMYTSGTTGPSKGVVSPHAQAHGIGRHLVRHFEYGDDDVLYTCLPLFHGNALWYSSYPALWADATLALAPRFSVSQFWYDIRRTGATQFNALGAMVNMLLKQPPSELDRQHSVRQSMALPLSREVFNEFSQRFNLKVTSVYAMTETFPVTVFTPRDPVEKGSSAGKGRGLADMIITDEEDQALPSGKIGEICVRPREPWIMMLGYYNMPEATLRECRNLWFHTGDRGYIDGDGYLFFVDRTKETIRRRGENISAYEVEMLVAKHPGVLEVAAIPLASELSEDDVMIYVVKRPGAELTEQELIRFCSQTMAYFMVPRFIRFADALPKTASEKVEKYKLKTMAQAERERLWDREKESVNISR